MIKKAKRTTIFNRLEQLETVQKKKQFIPVIVLDLEADGRFSTGNIKHEWMFFETMQEVDRYFHTLPGITEKTKIIVNDMLCVPDGLYLPADLILAYTTLEQRRKFIELAASDSVQWLNSYIEFLKTFFEIEEIDYAPKVYSHTFCYCGHWLTDEELKQDNIERQIKFRNIAIDVAKEMMQKYPAIVDLLEQFDKLSVPELLERYKDQKWFVKT